MRQESLDFLKRLANSHGPSGFEEETAEIWRDYVRQFAAVSSGVYGSVIGHINVGFPGPKIMLCGHIDEIGLMVKYINEDGFIYVTPIGGVDRANLIGRKYIIKGKEEVTGVLARKAAHLLSEDDENEIPKYSELPIDIGARSKEEAQEYVSVGDAVVVDTEFQRLLNDRVVGKSLDDRVGAWVVAEVLRELNQISSLRAQVLGVASIQEEIGGYGSIMTAESIKPHVALAIDLTHCTDVPDSSKEKHGDVHLGGGPVISWGSSVHKKVNLSLKKTAQEHGIPLQESADPYWTGTDADTIFIKNGGIPTGLVSVPNRYMHSPVEMVQLDDLSNTVKLIVEWCRTIKFNSPDEEVRRVVI